MPYRTEFLTQLKNVRQNIREANALTEFGAYLTLIQDIGPFSTQAWNAEWRTEIYKLGEDIVELPNAGDFITMIRARIEAESGNENNEVLAFIESELIWNFFNESSDHISTIIERNIHEYPVNPEFRHTHSHHLENLKKFEEAFSEAKMALRIESSNAAFLLNYVNKGRSLINQLFSEERIDQAETLVQSMLKRLREPRYSKPNNFIYTNYLASALDRARDYRLLQTKLDAADDRIEEKLRLSQGKSIEILGLFSGVIAFILATINLSTSSSFSLFEMLVLMLAMTLTLLVFVVGITFLFPDIKRDGTSKWKFCTILVILVLLGILICMTYDDEKKEFSTPRDDSAYITVPTSTSTSAEPASDN